MATRYCHIYLQLLNCSIYCTYFQLPRALMASWGAQFSSGDQGNLKEVFWRNMGRCPKCQEEKIKKDTHSAGCRMNGDGYGTDVFSCQSCGWTTSFQYDDASDTYYYETRFWERDPQKVVVIPRQELNAAFRAKFSRIYQIIGAIGTRGAMEQDGISADDITRFISELESQAASSRPGDAAAVASKAVIR